MSGIDVAIIGCGFVADFYMKTVGLRDNVRVLRAFDIDPAHAARFETHWKVPAVADREAFFDGLAVDVVLNLTNPDSHYPVSRDCLERGYAVWSEKPMAMTFPEVEALRDLAIEKGLPLASAPCNHLGEAFAAVRDTVAAGNIGQPLLAYAEMDDNFIKRSPYKTWINPSGAPWPYEDEFEVGCTLEHAGYCLTWLISLFGSVTEVHAFSALCAPGKPVPKGGHEAPDYSVANLRFESGMVVRLTCGVVAPRDHRFRIFGHDGELVADDFWFYSSPVSFRRWMRVRRRFMLAPYATKVKLPRAPVEVPGSTSAQMDFIRGPIELVEAHREGRLSRVPLDFCVHFNEVSLAIHESRTRTDVYRVKSRCESIRPPGISTDPDTVTRSLFERRVLPLLSRL